MAAITTVGLDHVVLRVADADRARAWYEGMLGCKAERVLPSLGLTQLRTGSALIDLVDIKGPVGKKGGALPGLKRRNTDHYCVQLAEFNEKKIGAHLERRGIDPGKVVRRYGAPGHGPSRYLIRSGWQHRQVSRDRLIQIRQREYRMRSGRGGGGPRLRQPR